MPDSGIPRTAPAYDPARKKNTFHSLSHTEKQNVTKGIIIIVNGSIIYGVTIASLSYFVIAIL